MRIRSLACLIGILTLAPWAGGQDGAASQSTATMPTRATSQPAPATPPAKPAAGARPQASTTQPQITNAPTDGSAPVIARDPASMTIPELLLDARRAFDNKDVLVAKSYVDEVFRREKDNVDASLLDADIAMSENEVDRAKMRYSTVLRVQPNDFEANRGLGKIYNDKKIWRQANWYLSTAQRVAPEDKMADVLVMLAQAREGMGKKGEAAALLTEAAKRDPDNLQALIDLSRLYLGTGAYDQALLTSQHLLDIAKRMALAAPGDHDVLVKLYKAYDMRLMVLKVFHASNHEMTPQGGRSDKLQAGKEAIAAETLREISDIMLRQAELAVRLAHFEILPFSDKAIEYAPDNVDVLLQNALLQVSTGNLAKARERLQRVLSLDPENADAKRSLESLPAVPESQ